MVGSGLYVAFGKGDGTFQPIAQYAIGGSGIVVGDFNGDSKPDIAVTSGLKMGTADSVTILLNQL